MTCQSAPRLRSATLASRTATLRSTTCTRATLVWSRAKIPAPSTSPCSTATKKISGLRPGVIPDGRRKTPVFFRPAETSTRPGAGLADQGFGGDVQCAELLHEIQLVCGLDHASHVGRDEP